MFFPYLFMLEQDDKLERLKNVVLPGRIPDPQQKVPYSETTWIQSQRESRNKKRRQGGFL